MAMNFEELFKKVWDDKESREEILKIYFSQDDIKSFSEEELRAFLKDILIENLINNASKEDLGELEVQNDNISQENILPEIVEEEKHLNEEKLEDSVITHENLQFTSASDTLTIKEYENINIEEIPLEIETISEDLENKKLVFIGPPNVGKTSIIRAYFYKQDPKEICRSAITIEPTKNYEIGTVKWSLLQLGIFDLSGQELKKWFSTDSETAFGDTDEVICVFDCRMKVKKIISILKNILPLKKSFVVPYVYLLLHKVDTLPNNESGEIIKKKIEEIHREYGMGRLKIFGTSLLNYKKFEFIMNWMLSSMEMPLFKVDLDTEKLGRKSISNSLLDTMRLRGELKEPTKEEEYVEIQSLRLSNMDLDGKMMTESMDKKKNTPVITEPQGNPSEEEYKIIKKFYMKEEKLEK
ncbi:MAG: ADP-ribosylation factor-like protein [Promethearchaeota archaeon]